MTKQIWIYFICEQSLIEWIFQLRNYLLNAKNLIIKEKIRISNAKKKFIKNAEINYEFQRVDPCSLLELTIF